MYKKKRSVDGLEHHGGFGWCLVLVEREKKEEEEEEEVVG